MLKKNTEEIEMNKTQEEDITFDSMPDFGGLFSTSKKKEVEDEIVYGSLYEELEKKCHPDNFLGEFFDKKKFDKANILYGELIAKHGLPDSELISLRNNAISELGIHISTKKIYDYLIKYIDPQIYTAIKPYDVNRVSKAGEFYNRLTTDKEDILALEKLEKDADDFINQRKQELIDAEHKKREEEKRIEQEKEQKRKKEEEDAKKQAIEEEKSSKTAFIIFGISILVIVAMIVLSVYCI